MTTRVDPTAGAAEFFTADHQACDDLWAAVEAAADVGDITATGATFAKFDTAMRRHFDMEEQVLFPAFERATGMTTGPTQVMRMEHDQIRGLLSQMASYAASDAAALVEQGDTLLMLTQQHNAKEEGVLYPMAARHLRAEWPSLAQKLSTFVSA